METRVNTAMDHAAMDKLMDDIVDAFNRHDVNAIVDFFAEGGVFQTARGIHNFGERIIGKARIGEFLTKRFASVRDMRWEGVKNWHAGNRAVSEWRVQATSPSGERIDLLGCDIYEFENGKIKVKDTFWKSRETLT